MSCRDLYRDMIERAAALEQSACSLGRNAKCPHVSDSHSVSMEHSALLKREHAADLRKFAARLPR